MLEIAPLSEGQRPLRALEQRGIQVLEARVEAIDPISRSAVIGGEPMAADALVVALGVRHAPEKIHGFKEHALNAYALSDLPDVTAVLRSFTGGHIIAGVFGMPYQCPPAPYEIAILTKEYFTRRGVDVTMTVISPQPLSLGAAGKESSDRLDRRMAEYGIEFVPNMAVTAVEPGAVVCGEVRLPCDLAFGVPPHVAVDVVRNSLLAAEDGWVHVDRHTLETGFADVYAIWGLHQNPNGSEWPVTKSRPVCRKGRNCGCPADCGKAGGPDT